MTGNAFTRDVPKIQHGLYVLNINNVLMYNVYVYE